MCAKNTFKFVSYSRKTVCLFFRTWCMCTFGVCVCFRIVHTVDQPYAILSTLTYSPRDLMLIRSTNHTSSHQP